MKTEYLFVYGTLRRDAPNSMAHLLAGRATWIGRAVWPGRLFLVGAYPGAVPAGHSADLVQGEVYRLTDPEKLLPELDVYEGCSEVLPATAEYERRAEEVTLAGGGRLTAWIYLYRQPTEGLPQLKTGDFLQGAVSRRRR